MTPHSRTISILAAFTLSSSMSQFTLAQSPFAKIEAIRQSEVKWTGGFWQERFSACRENMIPSMWEIMKGTAHKPFLEHFKIAAGLSEGGYHGAKWNDGDFYKWIEAVCAVQAVHHDPQWEKQLDEIIEIIGRAQRGDGYIHTPVLVGARNGDAKAKPFADRFNFEMYNMGHLMTTACLHHEVTEKDSLLKIARKAADFLDDAFSSPTPEKARHAICPSHYMGLIDLYRTTGEVRYLKLAERLIRMRDLVEDGGDDNQDRVPLTRQTEAVGHAVRANYLYAGMADLFAENGDRALWLALEAVWENAVEKKMYVTGGCGALHDGASPYGSKAQGSITRVHQAYGRNYQLPNATAHNETCANIGNVLWNWRMFLASGEARFFDVAELTLYNAVLSGVDLKGRNFFYTNPLRQEHTPAVTLRWPRERAPFFTSFCCPPNVVRTIAGVNRLAYGKSNDGIWVNLYGSNSLSTSLGDEGHLKLRQMTRYPWDGDIRITIDECREDPISLHLRIPGWTKRAVVTVDGEPINVVVEPGSYTEIKRVWRPGNTIRLHLEMPPRLLETHPLVEENRNQVAIKRGPIIYCLESTDLPPGVAIADVKLPRATELSTQFEPHLLHGVTVINGTINVSPTDVWEGKLYRDFEPLDTEALTTKFIPYFAWSNRGKSEMSVWLPLD